MTSLGEQSLFSSNRRKKRFCQTNGILEKTDVLFKRKYGQDNRKHEVVKRMIQAATAPIVAGLFYLYIRDKYEKEPWRMLVWGILFGVYATFVIYGAGLWLERTFPPSGNTVIYFFCQFRVGRRSGEVFVCVCVNLQKSAV